jgi:hypothetical protein
MWTSVEKHGTPARRAARDERAAARVIVDVDETDRLLARSLDATYATYRINDASAT